jgi:hypothetical protein
MESDGLLYLVIENRFNKKALFRAFFYAYV